MRRKTWLSLVICLCITQVLMAENVKGAEQSCREKVSAATLTVYAQKKMLDIHDPKFKQAMACDPDLPLQLYKLLEDIREADDYTPPEKANAFLLSLYAHDFKGISRSEALRHALEPGGVLSRSTMSVDQLFSLMETVRTLDRDYPAH